MAASRGADMICKDCGGNKNVGRDQICIECRKCRAQIPPEEPDPDWDAWLKPVFDLYGPPSCIYREALRPVIRSGT